MPGAPEAPQWIQWALGASMSAGVFIATLFGYINKGKQAASSNDVAVVSATFADRRTIEHLTETIDRLERTNHELCEESRRTRQSVEANTDAQLNMLRFIKSHSAD